MAKLCLKDVARYTEEMSPQELLANSDLSEYVEEMQNVGFDVIKSLTHEEIAAALAFLMSMMINQLLASGNIVMAMALMQDSDFHAAVAQAFRFSIGIVISEEWR